MTDCDHKFVGAPVCGKCGTHIDTLRLAEAQIVITSAARLFADITTDCDNAVNDGLVSPLTEYTEGQIELWQALPVVQQAWQAIGETAQKTRKAKP